MLPLRHVTTPAKAREIPANNVGRHCWLSFFDGVGRQNVDHQGGPMAVKGIKDNIFII